MGSDPERHVLRNAASSWVRDGVEALLFLILTPYLITMLGPDQYGLWQLVWAVVSILALIDMGFGTSVVKFIADARGRDDPVAHQTAVGTFFWTYVGQMVVVLILTVVLSLFIGQVFELDPADELRAQMAMLVLGAATAAGLPLGMFRGVLLGHQKQRVANYYKLAGSVLYFGAAIGILQVVPDVRALAAVNGATAVVALAAIAIHARVTLESVRLSPRHFSRPELGRMWSFSIYFVLIHVSTFIAARVDTFVIKWALDLEAVAIYAIAMRLAEKAAQVCLQLAKTLSPVVAELHGVGDEARLYRVWLRGTKLAVAFAAPLLVGLAILAEPLIVTWTDERFAPSAPVLQLLVGAVMVVVVHSNSFNMLSMRGEQRPLALWLIVGQLLNLGLSIALVRPYGLNGVAAATLVSSLLVNVIFIQGRAQRRHEATRFSFYRETLVPTVAPIAIMVGAMLLWQHVHPITSLVEVAIVEVVGVALFWAVFWKLGLNDEEREAVGRRLPWRRRAQ